MKKLLFLLIFIPGLAFAHGEYAWIEKDNLKNPVTKESCCGKDDCFQVPNPQELGDHFIVNFRGKLYTFPKNQTLLTRDGKNWACKTSFDEGLRCLFIKGSV